MQNGCDEPKNNNMNIILQIALIMSLNKVNGNIFITLVMYVKHMKKSEWLKCYRKRVFPKTKGDSIPGQDRAQIHCDFRFSQIEKKSKVAVLQLDVH